MPERCPWPGSDPDYIAYHDGEWGFPQADDCLLFEKLVLEGFQSGLSWLTILRKREAFRAAFAGFQMERVAAFGPKDVERLLSDAGIVRHRGKIEAAIRNAQAASRLAEEHGSLGAFLWQFEPPAKPAPASLSDVPSSTPESVALSRELKRRGFTFVGPVTCYAFFQACGLVNDHLLRCPARLSVDRARRKFRPPGTGRNAGQKNTQTP